MRLRIAILILLTSVGPLWADQAIHNVQQALKDQGFYYGEITGQKDADTTAAIRRYQIRNGLQITGDLNTETLRSLGINSKPPSIPSTRPQPTPGPPPPDYATPTPAPRTTAPPQQPPNDDYENGPEPPPPPRLESGSIFGGTPYEAAPPQVQQDIVARAQMILLRLGYYREAIDGLYGPAMNFALRNYQTRLGLEPTGHFDVETLASLSLLPEQRVTDPRRFHRRFWGPREPVYLPR